MKDIFSDDVLNSIDGAIEKSLTVRTFGVGEVIDDRFRVERVVGRGNFGYVYRAKEETTGKTRAVKVFYERFTGRNGAVGHLVELGNRLTHLTTHPNLVRVFETGHSQHLVYFVEEFINALTLEKLVGAVAKHAPEGGFPADQLVEVMHQVCRVIEEHPEQAHFGLNPQNIFMSKTGVKIADLGIAGSLRPMLIEADFQIMSAQEFWAPEFRQSGILSGSADVYSLGKLLEYLLTLGKCGTPGQPPVIKGPHSPALLDLALMAGDHDPDLRPPTAGAFLGAFENARLALPPEGREATFAAAELSTEDQLAEAAESAMEALSERVSKSDLTEAVEHIVAIGEMDRRETKAGPEMDRALQAVEKEFFTEEGAVPAAEEKAALRVAEEAAPAAGPAARRSPLVWLAAAAVVLAVLAVVGYALKDRWSGAPAQPTPVADTNTFDLEGVTIMPEPGGPTFEEMVDALLVQADTYFKINRITDPPDESAYGIYTFVMDIDPKNVAAQDGMKKIENHYLTLGRGLLKNKKYDKAEWSFRKVLFVNEKNDEARSALDELTKLKSETTVAANTGNKPGEEKPSGGPAKGTEEIIAKPTTPTPMVAPLANISADQIKSTIGKYMGRVKFCFAKNPDAKGEVKMRFVVNPSGAVTNAVVAGSSIGNAEIEQCLVRRVMMMNFPAFEGSPKTVTFPFRFNE